MPRQDPGNEDNRPGWRGNVVEALKSKPAYVLVFGITGIIFVPTAVATWGSWLQMIVVLSLFALVGFTIWIVERRTSVRVATAADKAEVIVLRDQRAAGRRLLGSIADNNSDCNFVYSSTPVSGFMDSEGRKIDYPYTEDEKLVTTIPDAGGIAMVDTLLHLAGKTERLTRITARDFRAGDWDHNLILIGSRNSNPRTPEVLRNFNSPFRFSDDAKSIVEVGSTDGPWPRRDDGDNIDYGIVVKLRVPKGIDGEVVYLIIAGIGPIGTEACCYYLQNQLVDLASEFGDSAFACLLSVDKSVGYTHVTRVKPRTT